MLTIKLNEDKGIAILEPHGALTESDFKTAAAIIDPHIEASGILNGIIIHVRTFPGWESFAALINHLRFIRDHHQKVTHIAFATDSPVGALAEHVAGHFISAEIKHFSFDEFELAVQWIAGDDGT